jgi:hypothetical protein
MATWNGICTSDIEYWDSQQFKPLKEETRVLLIIAASSLDEASSNTPCSKIT